ncbi:YbgF trimerization domain-containing protein [Aquirhabdus sp.]|uniref:YbgF trimerization domain-containing protein n=1 Tax=Aquirhabdus sp. TaxID=2824160 RepID=UPI00396CB38A
MRNIALKTNLKKTIPVVTLNTGFTRLSLSLGLMMGLITTTLSTHAAIPVESRPLTSSSAVGGVDSTQTSQLWQLTQQIQKLENEVRDLRGKVETHDNDIDQLQKEAKNHYTDFDQRIAQSQDDIKKLQAAQAPAPAPTTTPPADGAPATTTAPGTPPVAAATGDEADKVAYIAAYDAYKAGGAAKAIAPMKKFITDYPNSPFVPNAYYWLGEFNLAITPPNFAAASSNFKIVSNQYPKSAKAAAATYRLATLADVDQHQASAIALMKTILKNYPGTQEAGYATDYLKSHSSTSTEEKKATPKKTDKVKAEEATNQKAKPATKKKVKAKEDDDTSA